MKFRRMSIGHMHYGADPGSQKSFSGSDVPQAATNYCTAYIERSNFEISNPFSRKGSLAPSDPYFDFSDQIFEGHLRDPEHP